MKPPQVETIVDWHQDLSYYPLTNRDSVAVLLYLDDADEENGALRVVPREQSRADAMLDHASEDGFFQGRIPTFVRPRPATPRRARSSAPPSLSENATRGQPSDAHVRPTIPQPQPSSSALATGVQRSATRRARVRAAGQALWPLMWCVVAASSSARQ